jgi:hypothetical protein
MTKYVSTERADGFVKDIGTDTAKKMFVDTFRVNKPPLPKFHLNVH